MKRYHIPLTLAALSVGFALTGCGFCGDGFVFPPEECDDGNAIDTDACTNACTLSACGDGIVSLGESCDDGNTTSGDGCRGDCQKLEVCGDGELDSGEDCDDGNGILTDDCPDGAIGSCVVASCSDGFVHSSGTGTETDVDCGGSCPDCDIGQACLINEDCESAICWQQTCMVPGGHRSGVVSMYEASVQGMSQLGQGLEVSVRFSLDAEATPPSYDDTPGSVFGCKVWEQTPPFAEVFLDEGTVQISPADTTPAIPPCTFTATEGYVCIGGSGAGGTIALLSAPQGLWTLTDPEIVNASKHTGRYLRITGAQTAANNGLFPVISSASVDTVVFINLNPSASQETLLSTATFAFIAGMGPIPGMPDPGFLNDDEEITVALTPGGNGDFDAFSTTFDAGVNGVGDDFLLNIASQEIINAMPTDSSAFTIGCEGAGGICGSAMGTSIEIVTTDGVIPPGAPAYFLPSPLSKRVTIRCSALNTTELQVPTEVSTFLQTSGATRIKTSFARFGFKQVTNAPASLPATTTIYVGHVIHGYTTP